MKLGQLEVDLKELDNFLVSAKRRCYAGGGEKVILPDGSKQLTFQEGDFHYTDNYDGFNQTIGTEIVRWQKPDGQRIWQMIYSGGIIPEYWGDEEFTMKVFDFLVEVKKKISRQAGFGKPISFNRGNWGYYNRVEGSLERFRGRESISLTSGITTAEVFTQDLCGGLVVPK